MLQEDTAPRAVAVPPDLAAALRSAPRAKAFFETLAHTYRREYVQWIEGARGQDTRRDRVARAVTLLEQEKKTR